MRSPAQATIETYDKIARVYADYTFPRLPQYQLNEFISLLPRGAKVLDAGCGPGRDAGYFADFNLDVVGVDASKEMIKEAKQRIKGATFKVMPVERLSFKTQTFDGIWAMATLLHLHREEVPAVLQGFYRILKPDGILFLGMKAGAGEEVVKSEEYYGEPRWYVYYSIPELMDLVAAAGFHVLKAYAIGEYYLQLFAKKAQNLSENTNSTTPMTVKASARLKTGQMRKSRKSRT